MDETITLALIGCGSWVYDTIYECTKNLPVRLAAICDSDEAKRLKFAERYRVASLYSDYKEMLANEQLDAVIAFPSDISLHYGIARDCLSAGVHIFIERPQCMAIEEANELIELQNRMSKYAMPRFNKRFTPAYIMAKEIIQRQEFDRVTMYWAKYQATEYESEHSFIYKHIIHHLDLARFLLGEIALTHVDRIKWSDKRIGYNISFKTAEGAIGSIQSGSFQSAGYPTERVEITGVGKNVIVDNIRSVQYNRNAPKRNADIVLPLLEQGDTLFWNINNGNNSNFTYHGFENQLHHFVRSILAKSAPLPHMEDTIHTLRLLESLRSS